MKTKILFFSILCLSEAYAGTAGAANNDPLVFYAIALLILGVLIGTPSLIKFIKNRIKARQDENGENELTNSENPI